MQRHVVQKAFLAKLPMNYLLKLRYLCRLRPVKTRFDDCKVIQGVGLRKQDRQRSRRHFLAPKPDWSRWQQPPSQPIMPSSQLATSCL